MGLWEFIGMTGSTCRWLRDSQDSEALGNVVIYVPVARALGGGGGGSCSSSSKL